MNDIDELDFNLLKSLHALLSECHVGRAAALLGVTQPALSHALRRLRDRFDDPLLTRVGNRMVPTPRALELQVQLVPILAGIEALITPADPVPDRFSGRVRIATHDFIASEYLPLRLQHIRRAAPGLRIELGGYAPTSLDKLNEGTVDLVIGAGLRAHPGLLQRVLVTEPLVCLLDATHPALRHWTAEEVMRTPHLTSTLIAPEYDPVATHMQAVGAPARQVGMVTESLQMQPALLRGTDMIAFLPKSLAVRAAQDGGLAWRPCPFDLPPVTIHMLWSERLKADPRHRWVRRVLHEGPS